MLIIVHPPAEEDFAEPCVSYSPEETLLPLGPDALCSVFMTLGCLPFINEELPYNSTNETLSGFVRMMMDWHSLRDVTGSLSEWIIGHGLPLNCLDGYSRLMGILSKTRFGQRFGFTLSETSLNASTNTLVNSPLNSPVNSPLNSPVNSSTDLNQVRYVLEFPMAQYSSNDTLPLVTLLNNRLSQDAPSFYPSAVVKKTGPKTQLTNLPLFLSLYFDRELTPNGYHSPSIELPMEMDLGFYMDPSSPKPRVPYKNASSSPTFYRLHGFVTQLNGSFIVYSRIRSGSTWFKVSNEVLEVDLGSRVSSRGVMLAIYRLQDY